MTRPLLSVCVPAYQAGAYIEECVESAIAGGYAPLEVVVVDDASTDATSDLVRPFVGDVVRLVRNERNLGRLRNIVRSLELATGDLLLVLPADCRVVADSLRQRAEVIAGLDRAAFAFGAATLIDETGATLGAHTPFRNDWSMPTGVALRRLLPWDPVYTSTCMFTRRAFDAVGGFREDLAPSHRDWDLFLRMSLEGEVAYLEAPQAEERVHHANATRRLESQELIAISEFLVLDGVTEWVAERHPDLTDVVWEARLQWSRTQVAHAILAKLGLDQRSTTRSLGLALLGSPRIRRTFRYWVANLVLSLPDPIARYVLAPAWRRWQGL